MTYSVWRILKAPGTSTERRFALIFFLLQLMLNALWSWFFFGSHSRVRMVVASFLIKDLLLHWRHGEAWFWDTLVDADSANNAANW